MNRWYLVDDGKKVSARWQCEFCGEGHHFITNKWWDCPVQRDDNNLTVAPDTTWRKGLNSDSNPSR
jgi:hypothetical protein